MENLTKQQIVLLTLLVSFVTSIATGIVTVSLLDQAPPGVTQTINRVVEKTIERVVQVPTQAATVIQKETIVVKEEDQAVSAIEKNSKSLVRIFEEGVTESNPEPHPIFQGLGFVVSKDGIVVADAKLVGHEKLTGQFQDGSVFPIAVMAAAEGSPTLLLKATLPDKSDYIFSPVVLGNSNTIKLGQSVISLSGRTKNSVNIGLISSLKQEEKKDKNASSTASVASVTTLIETTVSQVENTIGSPLLSLSGEVIGIRTSQSENQGSGIYTPSSFIISQLKLLEPTTTTPAKKI